jgi:hypothetical protein
MKSKKRRQETKLSAKARRRRQQRQQQELAAAARGERYEKRLASRDERLHSIGAPLQEFFGPLGMDVDLLVHPDRDVYVVGGRAIANWEHVPAGSDDHEIDKFVAKHLAKRFVDSVTTNAAPLWPGARAYYTKSDHGFVLAWPEAEVGFVLICPTHARVFQGGPTLRANYLSPGAHWEQLKHAIDGNEAKQREGPTDVRSRPRAALRTLIRVPLRVLVAIPEEAPRATARFLVEASRRLRLERQMVYGAAVVLEADFGRVRFDPIEGPATDLIAPFELSCEAGTVEGGIALSGECDPLQIELYRDDVEDDMFVWSTALCGYADLTTWDLLAAARNGRPTTGRRTANTTRTGVRGDARSRDSARPGAKRRLPRARSEEKSWPPYLKPLGHTALNLASFVAGHRRLLAPGWTPSVEAIERASLVGIKLGPDETWVRPHVRGTQTGDELRFAWRRRRALTGSSR